MPSCPTETYFFRLHEKYVLVVSDVRHCDIIAISANTLQVMHT